MTSSVIMACASWIMRCTSAEMPSSLLMSGALSRTVGVPQLRVWVSTDNDRRSPVPHVMTGSAEVLVGRSRVLHRPDVPPERTQPAATVARPSRRGIERGARVLVEVP
jgi:hypothetical protein